jgi:tripartite-type tricarboxylate transporter receptor subunit TctC
MRAATGCPARRLRANSQLPLPTADRSHWVSIVVPKNTPKSTIDKIDAEVRAIQKRPEIQQKLRAMGAQIASTSPAQLEQHIRKEIAEYRTLVERAHIASD